MIRSYIAIFNSILPRFKTQEFTDEEGKKHAINKKEVLGNILGKIKIK